MDRLDAMESLDALILYSLMSVDIPIDSFGRIFPTIPLVSFSKCSSDVFDWKDESYFESKF